MKAVRILCVLSGAMLAACSPSAPEPPIVASRATPAEKPQPEAVIASNRFVEWLRTDRAAVVHEIALKEFAVQSRLMEITGLTKEFGGTDRAHAALRDLMTAIEASGAPPESAQWTSIESSDKVSGSFNVAQAAVEIAGVVQDYGKTYKEGEAGKTGHTSDTDRAVLEVDDGSIEYTSAKDVTASGLHGQFSLHMKVNVCPNAAGEILVELTGKAAMSSATTGRGANTDFTATARRTVDDDAHFDSLDVRANLQSAEFGGSSGAFVELEARLETSARVDSRQVKRRSSKATDADVANGESLVETIKLLAVRAVSATEDIWANGKCVKINTESTPGARSHVKPSTSFSLYAGPRSKVDGSFVGGTVRATLTGGSSVDPSNTKIRADGKFSYVAPGERDQVAAVSLEARSKRGVGSATLDFDTKTDHGYHMRGGGKGLRLSGDVCNLEDTFYLHGEGPDNKVDMRFEPAARDHGRYAYSGTMTGYDSGEKFTFRVHGKGEYKIRFDGEVAVSARAQGPGTVETQFGPQTGEGVEEYTLTPLDKPDCDSNAEAAKVSEIAAK